jgi:uncharacterized protein (DUF952 family)
MKPFILCISLLASYGYAEEPQPKEIQVQQDQAIPEHLYKILSPEEWKESQLQKHVIHSSMDTDFIHLSTEAQLAPIAQKYWNNKDHIILKLISKKLTGRLAYETNPGGVNRYYHLYDGNIPLEAVVEIVK